MKNQRQQISVNARSVSGRQAVKRLRAEGSIPGVIYGSKKAPQSVSINGRSLSQLLRSETGEHGLFDISVEAENKADSWSGPVLIKEVQHDVVTGHVLHVDFQAVNLTEKIHVPVSIHLEGEAIGVRQDSGVLEHFMREVDLECLPTDIPDSLSIDISELKIGDSLHVGDLQIPEGAKILEDEDAVIVTVQAPRKEEVAADEAEAGSAEPEVIREKKEEAGEASDKKKEEKS